MNKTKALGRLATIEEEARKLRAIIEAPESLLRRGPYGIGMGGERGFLVSSCRSARPLNGNAFDDPGVAANYARALSTMLRLRHQPGTVPATGMPTERSVSGNNCHFIEPHWSSTDDEWVITIRKCSGVGTMLARISPPFIDAAVASKAIDTIGEADLLHMFFTFHHFIPLTVTP